MTEESSVGQIGRLDLTFKPTFSWLFSQAPPSVSLRSPPEEGLDKPNVGSSSWSFPPLPTSDPLEWGPWPSTHARHPFMHPPVVSILTGSFLHPSPTLHPTPQASVHPSVLLHTPSIHTYLPHPSFHPSHPPMHLYCLCTTPCKFPPSICCLSIHPSSSQQAASPRLLEEAESRAPIPGFPVAWGRSRAFLGVRACVHFIRPPHPAPLSRSPPPHPSPARAPL